MATATQLKCDCPTCSCGVDLASAIKKDGKTYCSDACATGHPDGTGCGHDPCQCCG